MAYITVVHLTVQDLKVDVLEFLVKTDLQGTVRQFSEYLKNKYGRNTVVFVEKTSFRNLIYKEPLQLIANVLAEVKKQVPVKFDEKNPDLLNEPIVRLVRKPSILQKIVPVWLKD